MRNALNRGLYKVLREQGKEGLILPWAFWHPEESRNQVASTNNSVCSTSSYMQILYAKISSLSSYHQTCELLLPLLPFVNWELWANYLTSLNLGFLS